MLNNVFIVMASPNTTQSLPAGYHLHVDVNVGPMVTNANSVDLLEYSLLTSATPTGSPSSEPSAQPSSAPTDLPTSVPK